MFAKRGLPHPVACPLCDQVEETIQHCLVTYVFSKEVWFVLFIKLWWSTLPPQPSDRFLSWWRGSVKTIPKEIRKGLNSLIVLVAQEIWKHHIMFVYLIAEGFVSILFFRKWLMKALFGVRQEPRALCLPIHSWALGGVAIRVTSLVGC